MADIHTVAKEAGVSVATVSRVINKHPSVSQKTRTKVEAIIEKLKYEPNMLGRNLRSSKSRLILVLIPTISNPFYAKIISGIETVAIKNNYNIMLCTTDANSEREILYFDLVKQRLADGMISIDPSYDFYDLLASQASKYAVILCGEYASNRNAPCISIDNTTAAYRAVKHLIAIGHKKIAMINSNIYTAGLRKQGYMKAMEEHGIDVNPEWLVHADVGLESTQHKMQELMALKDRPTAVFAVSDMIAISALKAIKDLGLKVPQDIAVSGFDNIEISALMNPALTTISQPMYEMGDHAANMLLKRIVDPEAVVKGIVLDHELIIRESTMV